MIRNVWKTWNRTTSRLPNANRYLGQNAFVIAYESGVHTYIVPKELLSTTHEHFLTLHCDCTAQLPSKQNTECCLYLFEKMKMNKYRNVEDAWRVISSCTNFTEVFPLLRAIFAVSLYGYHCFRRKYILVSRDTASFAICEHYKMNYDVLRGTPELVMLQHRFYR